MSRIAGVGSMISSAAMPATGESEDDAGTIAASLGGLKSDRLEASPDLGHIFDANPVQLDVLPVGHIGGIPREIHRDLTDDPQLFGRQRAAVDADAQHEVLIVQLPRLERRSLATIDTGSALGVEPVPPEATTEVIGIDGSETALRIDVSIRARTLSGLSSFLDCSLGLRGSR